MSRSMARSNASTNAEPEREGFWFGLLLDAAHAVPFILLVDGFGAEAKPSDAGVLLHITREKVIYLCYRDGLRILHEMHGIGICSVVSCNANPTFSGLFTIALGGSLLFLLFVLPFSSFFFIYADSALGRRRGPRTNLGISTQAKQCYN